jgi:hypothetical protein
MAGLKPLWSWRGRRRGDDRGGLGPDHRERAGSAGGAARVEEWIAARRAQGAWEQAEVHRLAWESLCAVLDDLHEVLGTARLGLDEVAAIIAEALREQTLGWRRRRSTRCW